MPSVVGVRFKKACKVYEFESNGVDVNAGDMVIVEVEKGLGIATAVSKPREIEQLPRNTKKIVRKADTVDLDRNIFNTERENEAFRICREKIVRFKLPMKLIRVEYLFDSSKAVFYFTSDIRVDFRELVKELASGFHTRIEMRQIGVRDEAKMIGGLGPCGRELCCAGFLSDFEPVTIKMAKDQNLALNPVKISGICGRLMCCLSYEHGMYQEEKRARAEAKATAAAAGAAVAADGSPSETPGAPPAEGTAVSGHGGCAGHGSAEGCGGHGGARTGAEGGGCAERGAQGGRGDRGQGRGDRGGRSGAEGGGRGRDRNNVRGRERPKVASPAGAPVDAAVESRAESRHDAPKTDNANIDINNDTNIVKPADVTPRPDEGAE